MASIEVGSAPEDKPQSSPSIIHKAAAEFIGTFIFMFIGVGSTFVNRRVNITLIGVASVFAATVLAMTYTIGHISGCHINPAVTIAFAAVRQFPWKQVPLYVVAQILGSTLASLTLSWMFDGEDRMIMLSTPGGNTSNSSAVACEIIVTFILMFVVCGSATDAMAVKDLAAVAVGATIFINIVVATTVSGASMNPARSLGPALAIVKFHKVWIYVISPVIGAVAGSMSYSFLRTPEPKKNSNKN